jgi:hypothetical protein
MQRSCEKMQITYIQLMPDDGVVEGLALSPAQIADKLIQLDPDDLDDVLAEIARRREA